MRPLFRAHIRLELSLPPLQKEQRACAGDDLIDLDTVDAGVLDTLKAWRREQARQQAVPPDGVFHDRTLAELAARRPSSLGDLGGISGIGAATLERYSEALLKVLASPAKGLPGIDPDGAIHRH